MSQSRLDYDSHRIQIHFFQESIHIQKQIVHETHASRSLFDQYDHATKHNLSTEQGVND